MEQCGLFMISLRRLWKGRRKDKDSPTPPVQEECREYMDEQCLRQKIVDADFYKLVSLPPCLDHNEWLATHTISFFNHVNLMYGVVSEFCTADVCSSMTGPGNVQFWWYDEKGKKVKYTAPQYVDYVTSFIQKTVSDDTVFPTKFGQVFPNTFEATVKKIHKYLFHILAHIYHTHFKELQLLTLNAHMNTLFTHFTVFNIKFDLIDEKETEVLSDLIKALIKHLPDPNQNEGSEVAEISRT
ncbi:hypothetical protein ACJMK2_020158 [Sinanodonta woodiana]|uniref:MOB kinase activator-like 2 n=1 Tax=Sinanodonta woodiana TaxID=1069815 RepID=A0ABD3TZI9_SINWO